MFDENQDLAWPAVTSARAQIYTAVATRYESGNSIWCTFLHAAVYLQRNIDQPDIVRCKEKRLIARYGPNYLPC